MSLRTVSAQFYGDPQIKMTLKPPVFYPRPDVESCVVFIDVYDAPPVNVPDETSFFAVVRAGFGQKRKQLKNSLAKGLSLSADETAAMLDAAKVDGTRRAETLTLEEWAALTRAYRANSN
jgi:16S rRNA (adenine1518-N6/adenine1519-N6)-dimethyltransferase